MTKSFLRVRSVHLVNVEHCQAAAEPQSSQWTLSWESAFMLLLSHSLLPFIITYPGSWY